MATAINKKSHPFRLSPTILAKTLTHATTRPQGLKLKVSKVGSVEVKAFIMLITRELVLVRRKNCTLIISVGGHELRVYGGGRNETPLHIWAYKALDSNTSKKQKILYGNPSPLFDLY